jgi:RNA polymerase sigma-70 factor, ECF subfamily
MQETSNMGFEPKDDDFPVIERVLAGDVKQYAILVQKYQKRVYYLALRMTKNHDVADELAQESFVKAYLALSTFQKGRSFYTWIYRITVNLVLNYIKHASFTVSLDNPERRTFLESIPESPDQLSRMVNEEEMQQFQKALDELPAQQRVVFMLRVYEDLPYEKIAEIVGCSVGTVMSRLFRARNRLKNSLKDYEKRKNGRLQE